jgi:hypothetical protein
MRPGGNPDWKKGVSPNPSGRPHDTLGKFIREHRDLPEILYNKLIKLSNSPKEIIQLRAIEILSERGWGKSMQSVALSSNEDYPICIKVEFINGGKFKNNIT